MKTVSPKWPASCMCEKCARAALTIYCVLERNLEMMAMLFAQRVILGKTEFAAVPAKLKQQVADILIEECGLPELVPAGFGGKGSAGANGCVIIYYRTPKIVNSGRIMTRDGKIFIDKHARKLVV